MTCGNDHGKSHDVTRYYCASLSDAAISLFTKQRVWNSVDEDFLLNLLIPWNLMEYWLICSKNKCINIVLHEWVFIWVTISMVVLLWSSLSAQNSNKKVVPSCPLRDYLLHLDMFHVHYFLNSFNNWNCEANKIQVEQKKTLIVIRTCCNVWTVCLFAKCYGIERVLVFFLISIILYSTM